MYRNPKTYTHGVGVFMIGYVFFTQVLNYQNVRVDQMLIGSVLITCCYQHHCRLFLRATLGMFLVGVMYDSLGSVFPIVHKYNPPRARPVYDLEMALFGITKADGSVVSPPEWWIDHYQTWLDLPCAFAYCVYLWQAIGYAIYLYAAGHKYMLRKHAWSFWMVNMIGFSTYFIVPASPPWYKVNHGLGEPVDMTVKSNPARLIAVDEYLGINYFGAFYGRSSNVHGALPSLHCAYPLLTWLYSREVFPRANFLFFLNAALTGFAAVYLCHHYIIDVLLGIIYSLFTYYVVSNTADNLKLRDERFGLEEFSEAGSKGKKTAAAGGSPKKGREKLE